MATKSYSAGPLTPLSILQAAPAMIVIAGFVVLPVAITLWMSLQSASAFSSNTEFTGISNYSAFVTSHRFWLAIKNTMFYGFGSVFCQVLLGVTCAVAIVRLRRWAPAIVTLLVLPYVLPTSLVAIVWKWLFHSERGLMLVVLNSMGLAGLKSVAYGWFEGTKLMITLIAISTWQFAPFVLLVTYAQLLTIPESRYQSASVDGLDRIQRFFKVTLPSLKPVLIAVIVLRILWMCTKFDTIWLVAGRDALGGKIETLPIMAYRVAFLEHSLGGGAAITGFWILLMIVGCLLIGRLLRSKPKWKSRYAAH